MAVRVALVLCGGLLPAGCGLVYVPVVQVQPPLYVRAIEVVDRETGRPIPEVQVEYLVSELDEGFRSTFAIAPGSNPHVPDEMSLSVSRDSRGRFFVRRRWFFSWGRIFFPFPGFIFGGDSMHFSEWHVRQGMALISVPGRNQIWVVLGTLAPIGKWSADRASYGPDLNPYQVSLNWGILRVSPLSPGQERPPKPFRPGTSSRPVAAAAG